MGADTGASSRAALWVSAAAALFAMAALIYSVCANAPAAPPRPDAERIQALIRQAARWAVAAGQDTDVLIRVLHANYAAGYLWASLNAFSEREIEAAMGSVAVAGAGEPFSVARFKAEITRVQDRASRSMLEACPEVTRRADGEAALFLRAVAGEG